LEQISATAHEIMMFNDKKNIKQIENPVSGKVDSCTNDDDIEIIEIIRTT
jgi:hypothetical protein